MSKNNNLKDFLVDVADAIRSKTGATGLINPQDFSARIASIQTGGGGGDAPSTYKGDVTFYDYDGAVLYSYSKDVFLALSAMPGLPTRNGLICQGWNWSLEDAIAYVTEYGKLNIGATYITDDGRTRLYISVLQGRQDIVLYFKQTVANGVTIDWGDGSATETNDGSTGTRSASHHYEPGEYCITFEVAQGCVLGLGGDSSTYSVIGGPTSSTTAVCKNMLRKVEIGNGVNSIASYAFFGFNSLNSVTIPKDVTSIGAEAFKSCYSLTFLTLPNGMTTLGIAICAYCYALKSVAIPNGVTTLDYQFFNRCYFLESVTIPNSVTKLGGYVFQYCYALDSIVIPNSITTISIYCFSYCSALESVTIPNSVTTIGVNAFEYCYAIKSLIIPDSVKTIGNYAFRYCYALRSIVLPNSITTMGYNVFHYCSTLAEMIIPNKVATIDDYSFAYCSRLVSITIPSSVTTIDKYAFQYCDALGIMDFTQATVVPSLTDTSVFSNISSDCKIIVPDALYDEWIAATNWSTHASNIIKKSDWDAQS